MTSCSASEADVGLLNHLDLGLRVGLVGLGLHNNDSLSETETIQDKDESIENQLRDLRSSSRKESIIQDQLAIKVEKPDVNYPIHSENPAKNMLNLESDEDKEIAARSVALVISSSRKGIVSLCADFATLLRIKKRYEDKLCKIRRENEKLKLRLAEKLTQRTVSTEAILKHDSSGASKSSFENNFKQTKPLNDEYLTLKNVSTQTSDSDQPNSINLKEYIYYQKDLSSNYVKSHKVAIDRACSPVKNCLESQEPLNRSNTVSQEVQTVSCFLSEEELSKLQDYAASNEHLEQELTMTKRETKLLKDKLRMLENKLSTNHQDIYHSSMPQQSPDEYGAADRTKQWAALQSQNICLKTTHSSFSRSGLRLPLSKPLLLDGFIPGCLCANCELRPSHRRSNSILSDLSKIPVKINDYVIIRGNKMGHIRYIGHLDRKLNGSLIYAGVLLDSPVGLNDGSLYGKRYFGCEQNFGDFIPLHDIVCLVNRKTLTQNKLNDASLMSPRCNVSATLARFNRSKNKLSDPSTLLKSKEISDPCI